MHLSYNRKNWQSKNLLCNSPLTTRGLLQPIESRDSKFAIAPTQRIFRRLGKGLFRQARIAYIILVSFKALALREISWTGLAVSNKEQKAGISA